MSHQCVVVSGQETCWVLRVSALMDLRPETWILLVSLNLLRTELQHVWVFLCCSQTEPGDDNSMIVSWSEIRSFTCVASSDAQPSPALFTITSGWTKHFCNHSSACKPPPSSDHSSQWWSVCLTSFSCLLINNCPAVVLTRWQQSSVTRWTALQLSKSSPSAGTTQINERWRKKHDWEFSLLTIASINQYIVWSIKSVDRCRHPQTVFHPQLRCSGGKKQDIFTFKKLESEIWC